MPPLSLIPSSFAICLRCQFRYSHRLQLPRRMALPQMRLRSVAFFTTTPLLRANAPSPRELVILEPPGPRKSLHRYAPPPRDLDDTDLGSGIQQLLTFEFKDQDVLDATHIGILLCKPHVTKVSKERYEQIFMEINHAFLRPQLLEYYSKSMQVGKRKPSTLNKAPKKGELLHEIMRNMWGIEVTDEIAEREDVLMNEEIKSNRRDIFFMISEDGRALREWAQLYSTRITVNVQTSILQLRGSLANIEKIKAEIESMLEKIITEDIDLSWVSRLETFNDEFITPIARITNTFIERVDDNTIRVVALGPTRHAIEDVRRLLFTSLDLQFRSSYSLLYNAPRGREEPEGALYPFTEDSSLPWRFRGRNWGRWRDVRRKIPEPSMTEPNPLLDQGASDATRVKDEKSWDGLGEVRRILDESANQRMVGLEEKQVPAAEYQVVLGCLLHDSDGHSVSKGPKFLKEFIKEEKPKVLSQDFPGVSFIAQMPHSRMGTPLSDEHQTEPLGDEVSYSFILKFAPSPWAVQDTFEHFPPLEMTLMVDPHTGKAGNPNLVAVLSESIADFLLPSQTCDLRFLRRVKMPLSLGSPEVTVEGITKEEMARFMGESNLNPISGDKLRASPQIKVSIPPQMMEHCSNAPTREVEYIFTGMEFRRELKYDWAGHFLHYSVVEGGVSGGRKPEVKLVCNTTPKVEKQLKEVKGMGRGIEELQTDKGAEEVGFSGPQFETSKPQVSESKFEALNSSTLDHETPEAQELERYEPEMREPEKPAEVYDTAFSSFVDSTMELVKSLEERLSDSISGGKGVLR